MADSASTLSEVVEAAPSPPESSITSPIQRPDSPSPSVTPSLALDAVPLLDRSVSTPSSTTGSTLSTRSRHSRLSDGSATVVRRRGYMRPQGTAFADSARNRDSVMSLGSIAHMQYYFARTGLLDGKGAQLARGDKKKKGLMDRGREMQGRDSLEPSMSGSELDFSMSSLSLNDSNSAYAVSESGMDNSVVESPIECDEIWDPSDPTMLPPTVSTYKVKPEYTEPLPDMPVLRRELKEALQDACKVLEESQKQPANDTTNNSDDDSGFYEIQGLHLLDIITLAIRAAKNYYTAHTNPQKLYALRSERNLRKDLYNVLDTLKRMASRNFRGGIRLLELTEILEWIESIDKLLKKEEQQEQEEQAEREAMVWREGDWAGKEREREWLFMKSFDQDEPTLPKWPEPSDDQQLPNEFLETLRDGQRLVKMHNACVAKSKRQFDAIKTWHTDVAKPYRAAENLRYWAKAAELRWDVHFTIQALDIVNGKDEATWKAFDEAIFKWCRGVREELTEEWRQEAQNQERKKPPELKIELPRDEDTISTNIEQSRKAPVGEEDKENAVPV
ncbi:hypothetical protein AC578_3347 [Pseudocercospora eumusae]|uniref:Calponin-homology (CH) domain-containing protein n=1 Tax=Pseudocercospora eumusae TaxID=321146 RepID=A0A139HD64_9PEZI|nr:hypothetical protein AC578_3347 [Pseudocercospora eumusae]